MSGEVHLSFETLEAAVDTALGIDLGKTLYIASWSGRYHVLTWSRLHEEGEPSVNIIVRPGATREDFDWLVRKCITG